MNMKRIFSLLTLSTALMFAACDDSNSASSTGDDNQNIESSEFSKQDDASDKKDKESSSEETSFEDDPNPDESNSDDNSKEQSSTSTETTTSSQSEAATTWRDYCLEVINGYRATEGIAPLTLADESKQECADKQSADDLAIGKGHAHFKACGEFSQNSGPNVPLTYYNTEKKIVDVYLEMMWNEKKLVESGEKDPNKDEDFPAIGHYLNMKRTSAKSVACGIAKSADGTKGWFNVNFY